MERLDIRLPRGRGCAIASTALLKSIHNRFSNYKINIYTEHPELFRGFPSYLKAHLPKKDIVYDVNLEKYTTNRRPRQSQPLRHMIIHMYELAQKSLDLASPLDLILEPAIFLNNSELNNGGEIVENYRHGKPGLWIATKSTSRWRDWSKKKCLDLIKECDEYSFIDLSNQRYNMRTAIAITKACDAGVCTDSFLLHGSAAIMAKNVIQILRITPRIVVSYDNHIPLDHTKDRSDASVSEVATTLRKLLG